MRRLTTFVVAGEQAYDLSPFRETIEGDLLAAIQAIRWPPGAARFTIRPVRHGNGVLPIKNGLVEKLKSRGWQEQKRYPRTPDAAQVEVLPGAFDVWLELESHIAAVAEWETGNISSSHRSINRMARALMENHIHAGYLIVPSRSLYEFLTDRIA